MCSSTGDTQKTSLKVVATILGVHVWIRKKEHDTQGSCSQIFWLFFWMEGFSFIQKLGVAMGFVLASETRGPILASPFRARWSFKAALPIRWALFHIVAVPSAVVRDQNHSYLLKKWPKRRTGENEQLQERKGHNIGGLCLQLIVCIMFPKKHGVRGALDADTFPWDTPLDTLLHLPACRPALLSSQIPREQCRQKS